MYPKDSANAKQEMRKIERKLHECEVNRTQVKLPTGSTMPRTNPVICILYYMMDISTLMESSDEINARKGMLEGNNNRMAMIQNTLAEAETEEARQQSS